MDTCTCTRNTMNLIIRYTLPQWECLLHTILALGESLKRVESRIPTGRLYNANIYRRNSYFVIITRRTCR